MVEQKDNPAPDFEQSLSELESLVRQMESGTVPLEESIAQFEQGIKLYRQCSQALKEAELRVDQLLNADDPDSAVAFKQADE
ncbi:MAG: exodeoxyribonuclease 7 small subunit [Lysobacteraceae bacterium]|nr:MAG: exodeoxyribonuclease 7 small subunit [Xanthomonadaceae bacterium]